MSKLESSNSNTVATKAFNINHLISTFVKPAVGCTEPAAIALAAASAFSAANGRIPSFIPENRLKTTPQVDNNQSIDDIDEIIVTLDTNVLKNALYVSIPGTNHHHGIDLAAILGVYGSADSELAVFESIKLDPGELLELIKEKKLKEKVTIKNREDTGIYIEAVIMFKDGTRTEALIRGSHANLISIKYNGEDIIKKAEFTEGRDIVLEELKELTVQDMIDQAENNLSKDSRKLIWEGILMNLKVADVGLKEAFGDGIGFAHKMLYSETDDVIGNIISHVAAATDVRMAGHNIPVMSNVGSGNQGLIITVALSVLNQTLLNKNVEEFNEPEKDKLIKTIALATEVTAYTTAYTGILSNLCGCLCKAGVGTAAGMGYLLYHYEPDAEKRGLELSTVILNSMKNMVASTCGVLCDGAKGSCANKSKSAGFNAYTSAKEAAMNYVGSGGIPGFENTDIKTIMKNFVETYIEKFGQPTDLHIVNYLLTSYC